MYCIHDVLHNMNESWHTQQGDTSSTVRRQQDMEHLRSAHPPAKTGTTLQAPSRADQYVFSAVRDVDAGLYLVFAQRMAA